MFPGKQYAVRSTQYAGDKPQRTRSSWFFHCILRTAICILLLSACRQKMANQPRYDPLEASDFFADGMASRPRIAGTVARGDISNDPFFDTGKMNGQLADGFPFAVTADVVDRGQERFNIYCSECHGRVGGGGLEAIAPNRPSPRPREHKGEVKMGG